MDSIQKSPTELVAQRNICFPSWLGAASANVAWWVACPAMWEVLRVFTRLGLTSFGGPTAHLGYFREEFVGKRKWLTDDEYAEAAVPTFTVDRNRHKLSHPNFRCVEFTRSV